MSSKEIVCCDFLKKVGLTTAGFLPAVLGKNLFPKNQPKLFGLPKQPLLPKRLLKNPFLSPSPTSTPEVVSLPPGLF